MKNEMTNKELKEELAWREMQYINVVTENNHLKKLKQETIETFIWLGLIIVVFSYVFLVGFSQYDKSFRANQQAQIDAQNKVIMQNNQRLLN